jgi:IclR family KDG regulon transcriptional repressor
LAARARVVPRTDGAQSVDRALGLLDVIARGDDEVATLQHLVEVSELNKSTVLRLLAAFEAHGYVTRVAPGRYRLGPSALALATAARSTLARVAHPHMQALVTSTGETALLHVLRGGHSVCIDRVNSPMPIRVSYEIGSEGPLFAGSSGKVLLAFMPDGDRERYLREADLVRYTGSTITGLDQLRADLELSRERGYVESRGELDEFVYGVGCPIWNAAGHLEAGLTLVGPGNRWSEEKRPFNVESSVLAAGSISRDLGYEPQTMVQLTSA